MEFLRDWNVFDKNGVTTASLPGIDVTGKPFAYINAYPIQATAHYYLGKRNRTKVFFGGAAPLTFIDRRVDVGLFTVTENKTHFSLAPEVGIAIPLQWHLRGVGNARWNYAASAGSVPSQQW